jgi:hypothetical protein
MASLLSQVRIPVHFGQVFRSNPDTHSGPLQKLSEFIPESLSEMDQNTQPSRPARHERGWNWWEGASDA